MSDKTATTTPPAVHPVTIEVNVRVQALAFPEPDGRYSVIVPALPGCVTVGDDIENAQANLLEAAEGWLEVAHDLKKAQVIEAVANS
jgi:predicted RNase H-like HicB family nuclease